ncbi:AAA family ATPase [Methylobacter sp.]|uniref:AAA family ATPase n=1 Tax=Methylobacter sp. TaxID=2051955 RepID=UPI003DA59E3A
MIICVGSVKGGVGKSLISTNLTVLRALKNKRVLLIDADEQGTSGDWTDHRTDLGISTPWTTVRLKGSAVRTEVQKLSKNYDDIIIDCGGRDTASLRAALIVSDVFLVPFQPKSFDIWTAQKVSELVDEAKSLNDKLRSYSFINCAGTRGRDNDDAKSILSKIDGIKLLPVTVVLRKSFSNATAEGLGVIELNSDKKAIQEIIALHDAVFKTQK